MCTAPQQQPQERSRGNHPRVRQRVSAFACEVERVQKYETPIMVKQVLLAQPTFIAHQRKISSPLPRFPAAQDRPIRRPDRPLRGASEKNDQADDAVVDIAQGHGAQRLIAIPRTRQGPTQRRGRRGARATWHAGATQASSPGGTGSE